MLNTKMIVLFSLKILPLSIFKIYANKQLQNSSKIELNWIKKIKIKVLFLSDTLIFHELE